jgi:hypothetical protein
LETIFAAASRSASHRRKTAPGSTEQRERFCPDVRIERRLPTQRHDGQIMRHLNFTVIITVFFLVAVASSALAGSSAIGDLEAITGQKIQRYDSSGVPPVPPPTRVPTPRESPASRPQDLNALVAGTIFQSLASALFNPNPQAAQKANDAAALAAQQRAAALAAWRAMQLQREKDAAFQAEQRKMLQSFGPLGGVQAEGFKGVSDSDLAFKTLDSDAEDLAADARKGFDTPVEAPKPVAKPPGAATPFFGDTMPIEDVRLLVNPENDPRVVDLRNAKSFIVKNLKDQGANPHAAAKQPYRKDNGKPIIKPPDCEKLAQRLKSDITRQEKFYKTVNLAQEQLNTWEDANRNALLNAAKDGIEYFTGELLEGLANRGKAADRLQRIFEKNAKQMAKEGVDVAAIEAKIRRLKMLSSAGRISELTSNIKDWQTFIKDGMSGLISQLTSSNDEIQEMLEDPKLQKYFETEAPELNTLLDLSTILAANKVFGKWVAKKVPIIAAVQLSINEAYDALDWILSFKRMTEADKINGKVMDTARDIQQQIDETYLVLQTCPQG